MPGGESSRSMSTNCQSIRKQCASSTAKCKDASLVSRTHGTREHGLYADASFRKWSYCRPSAKWVCGCHGDGQRQQMCRCRQWQVAAKTTGKLFFSFRVRSKASKASSDATGWIVRRHSLRVFSALTSLLCLPSDRVRYKVSGQSLIGGAFSSSCCDFSSSASLTASSSSMSLSEPPYFFALSTTPPPPPAVPLGSFVVIRSARPFCSSNFCALRCGQSDASRAAPSQGNRDPSPFSMAIFWSRRAIFCS